jgi:hypothetical protein
MEVLEELKSLWGGFISPRKDKRKHTLKAWMWVLSTDMALDLLRRGGHLLKVPIKRARSDYLLKHWRTGRTREEKLTFEEGFYALEDSRERRGGE